VGRNADVTREWIAAFNDRDFDALLAVADERVEWVVAREHPAAATHRGPTKVRGYLEDWLATMPDLRYEVEEIVESENLVLAIGRVGGAGAGSGVSADVPIATLTRFEEGRAVRVEEFLDPAEARAELERRAASPQ
jgi:ketosteroid isomerase-like protein